MNREMLKEAIAEAKTIKETAIASAKAALEEAFAPQLTAMFAERLNEMDEEEEIKKENYSMEKEGLEEDFSLEEILAELSKTEDDSEMKKEGTYENLDEDIMLEDMSDEDIEELVTSVIDDMIASGKLMAGEESEEEDEMEMDMDDMEDMEDMDMDMEDGEEEIEDDEIKIDELLAEILGEEEKVEEASLEAISNMVARAMESPDAGTAAAILAGVGVTAAAGKAIYDFVKARKKEKSMDETADTKGMEETINELKNELNEVNLLNAKLLYTNKIFKAKNLTESEKIKVLNTFDKAETVKEVKLVFETLNESFRSTVKKPAIKESLGSASRSIASAQTKQPIIEVNDAFARMQRLAGLKK
jgi:hypothetical protein